MHRVMGRDRREGLGRVAVVAVAAAVGVAAIIVAGALWTSTAPQVAAADLGRELFIRVWQSHDGGAAEGDGLGPLFNARSCAECHKQGGVGGGGPNENNVQLVSVNLVHLMRNDVLKPGEDATTVRERMFPNARDGVMVLHRFGTSSEYADWRLSRLKMASPFQFQSTTTCAIPLPSMPDISTSEPNPPPTKPIGVLECCCPPSPPNALEERNTPPLFGLGLLERVTLEDLNGIRQSQREEVRGRPAILADGRVGLFGWKGQAATLLDFNENACAIELGLTTPRFSQAAEPDFAADATKSSPVAVRRPGVDMTTADVRALTTFIASLPRPQVVVPDGDQSAHAAGRKLFDQIGCADCHTPQVGAVADVYSDLMLHRIGTSGMGFYGVRPSPEIAADPAKIPATADEFRTPPLWGVADSAPYLHDGSAATLTDAIARHQVQAERSSIAFTALNGTDRRTLLAFLNSLRAPGADVARREAIASARE